MSQAVVASIRIKYPTPLGAQHAAFLLETASALKLGLLKKDTGTNILLPDGTRVSQDIVMAPDGRIWDILSDGEGAAVPTFNPGEPVDPSRFYAVAAGAGAGETRPPSPPAPPPASSSFEQDVRAAIGRIEADLKAIRSQKPETPVVMAPDVEFPNYAGDTVLPLPAFLGGNRAVHVVLKPEGK